MRLVCFCCLLFCSLNVNNGQCGIVGSLRGNEKLRLNMTNKLERKKGIVFSSLFCL